MPQKQVSSLGLLVTLEGITVFDSSHVLSVRPISRVEIIVEDLQEFTLQELLAISKSQNANGMVRDSLKNHPCSLKRFVESSTHTLAQLADSDCRCCGRRELKTQSGGLKEEWRQPSKIESVKPLLRVGSMSWNGINGVDV